MRTWERTVRGTLVVGALALCGAASAPADELKWLGVHGAYYTQYEQGAAGVNARQDIGQSFSVGLLVDYVFRTERHTTWVGGVDLQWETALPDHHFVGWGGVGGGVIRDDPRDKKEDYSPFASAFVGVGLNNRPIMPYVELRIMSNRVFHGVVYAGLRF
jgi:hypothetical protein